MSQSQPLGFLLRGVLIHLAQDFPNRRAVAPSPGAKIEDEARVIHEPDAERRGRELVALEELINQELKFFFGHTTGADTSSDSDSSTPQLLDSPNRSRALQRCIEVIGLRPQKCY